MSNYSINIEALTFDATMELLNLDKSFVGTPNYMGLAYFWGHEYKHTLRDISIAKRRKIHNVGLKKEIDFIKPNKKAWYLIAEVLGTKVNKHVDIENVREKADA